METNQLLRANYLDIIFDGRNKLYGSYELRRNYSVRTRRATTMVLLAAGLAVTIPVIASRLNPDHTISLLPNTTEHILQILPKEDIYKPPVHVPDPPVVAPTVAMPIPKIVEDYKVTEVPTTLDDIKGKEIGKENNEGNGGLTAYIGGPVGTGNTIIDQPLEKPVQEKPFIIVEVPPAFNGDITEYLQSHLRYPESSRENSEEGRVILNFVVNEDGAISDVEVVRKAAPALDAEAIRVVKSMPNWKPGKQAGKAVKVYFNLPITFHLD